VAHPKCLIVTTHYRPLIGGALTVYDALAVHAGGAISLLTASRDYTTGKEVEGWRAFDDAANYTISRVPLMRIGLLPVGTGLIGKLAARLRAKLLARQVLRVATTTIKQQKIDVVCIGAQDALGWLVGPLKRDTGAKVIIYVHGEEVSQAAYSEKAEARRRAILHAADGLVAVSSFTVGILKQKYGVPAEKIKLQTNGVDLDKYNGEWPKDARKNAGLPEGAFVFSCGRLVERKGFDRLIEAWPAVVAAVPGVKLLVGGKGPLEGALRQRAKELAVEDSIEFAGWMSEEKLAAAYGEADIFTMPNRTMPDGDTEGFGLVFLEAAAMGTPSIGGKAGGAVDAIIDGETGLSVDAEKPEEISKALISLLLDKQKRQGLAEKAKAYARTQGWGMKTEEFLEYLKELTAGKIRNSK